MSVKKKIKQLQEALVNRGIDALIIPNQDPHQSEYLPEYWKTRDRYSGFTGSAGVLVVTADAAALWTDSRYFLQAEIELEGSGIALHKPEESLIQAYGNWIAGNLPKGSQVACNLNLLGVRYYNFLSGLLSEKRINLFHDTLAEDLNPDRPPLPEFPIFELSEIEVRMPRKEKLLRIRQVLKEKGLEHYLITALDDIAWTLNLRGRDIPFNPVFYAYLYIGPSKTILFVRETILTADITEKLESDDIEIRPYGDVAAWFHTLSGKEQVLADPSTLSFRLYEYFGDAQFHLENSIAEQLKCIKIDYEITSIRNTMAVDGAALVKAFFWLDQHPNRAQLTEHDFAERLIQYRRENPGYLSESFYPITGFRENGAIVHYRPETEGAKKLSGTGLFLVDSGGQYLGGTTDITRTIVLGPVSIQQQEHFTRVLKGHIALASAVFPKGTMGIQLDSLARIPLWEAGLNFRHGTGHGVGFCLNVHEGPQGISSQLQRSKTIFEAGMLTSNEPGLYIAGEYGIRIENLILCKASEKAAGFLEFETLSLFPIDRNLIAEKMLDKKEKLWLNDYHNKVWHALHPLLEPQEQEWLGQQCKSFDI